MIITTRSPNHRFSFCAKDHPSFRQTCCRIPCRRDRPVRPFCAPCPCVKFCNYWLRSAWGTPWWWAGSTAAGRTPCDLSTSSFPDYRNGKFLWDYWQIERLQAYPQGRLWSPRPLCANWVPWSQSRCKLSERHAATHWKHPAILHKRVLFPSLHSASSILE